MRTRVVVDPLGRRVEVPEAAARIVSLVPSQTELLFDLGVGDRVAGVTRYCVEPPEARDRSRVVGGTKRVHPERIRELSPDLILANREENTPEIVAELEAEFPVWVSDVRTLGDALTMIRAVGELTGADQAAREMADRIAHRVRSAGGAAERRKSLLRVAYLIWTNPLYAAGGGTFIDHMLGRAGLQNVFGDADRYPEIEHRDLESRQPQVILLPDEPFPFDEEHRQRLAARHPGARVTLVDGKTFSWYGSRLLRFAEDVRGLRDRLSGTPPAGHGPR